MDCIAQGATKSQTGMSDFHFHFLGYPAGAWKLLVLSEGKPSPSIHSLKLGPGTDLDLICQHAKGSQNDQISEVEDFL